MNTPGYSPNTFLNHNITIEEVKRAVDKAKSGIEGIPNEALKSPHLLQVFSKHALNMV